MSNSRPSNPTSIRKKWLEKCQSLTTAPDEDVQFAQVNILGFPIEESLKYTFNPNKMIAIWFSIDPTQGIRKKEWKALQKRTKIKGSANYLIVSSNILDNKALKTLKSHCSLHHIQLIDIDQINTRSWSKSSKEILSLAQQELKALNQGGNPASASDLIRWIPEIMKDKGFYADIDLPLHDYAPREMQTAGLPVVLNIGSIIMPMGQKSSKETCAINTDIIGFSIAPETSDFMTAVQRFLIQAYQDPFTVLEEESAVICKSNMFKKIKDTKNGIEALFALRNELKQCDTMQDFLKFLGADLFKELFKVDDRIIKDIKDSLETYSQGEIYRLYKTKSDLKKFRIEFNKKKDEIKTELFKPTVVAISGPGRIFTALGGKQIFVDNYRPNADPLPTFPLRVIQGYGCNNDMTGFISDNIPEWRVEWDEFQKKKQDTYNVSGLSWIPR